MKVRSGFVSNSSSSSFIVAIPKDAKEREKLLNECTGEERRLIEREMEDISSSVIGVAHALVSLVRYNTEYKEVMSRGHYGGSGVIANNLKDVMTKDEFLIENIISLFDDGRNLNAEGLLVVCLGNNILAKDIAKKFADSDLYYMTFSDEGGGVEAEMRSRGPGYQFTYMQDDE